MFGYFQFPLCFCCLAESGEFGFDSSRVQVNLWQLITSLTVQAEFTLSFWQDKVVIVAGASTGFGKVLAAKLVASQARVILIARDVQRLAVTADELNTSASTSVQIHSVDLIDAMATEAAVQKVVADFGKIDAVFNCVGKSTREPVLEVGVPKMEEMMRINLHTVINLSVAVLAELEKSKGHLVNIGSLASKTAWPYVTSYAVSKSAMATYTHQLRLEGPQDVHYLLVCPGPIIRKDSGTRYDEASEKLPEHARAGAAGAKVRGIPPERLAEKILRACVKRKKELIVPGYARLAFIASAISPALGDWILRKKMSK